MQRFLLWLTFIRLNVRYKDKLYIYIIFACVPIKSKRLLFLLSTIDADFIIYCIFPGDNFGNNVLLWDNWVIDNWHSRSLALKVSGTQIKLICMVLNKSKMTTQLI